MSQNGPPSGNPTPLEKTLMHLDLSKGVNERERPETANPVTTLTRMENLVQDQGGAYIKRPGNTALGGIDTGASYNPAGLLRLRDGLGMVDDASNFYVYQESTGKFRQRGSLPEFSVAQDLFASSYALASSEAPESCGSTSLFHFAVHSAGVLPFGTPSYGFTSARFLSIYDRNSGAVVAQYDVSAIGGLAAEFALCCAVDNRYIHVALLVAGAVKGFVLDTQAPFPATAASITTFATLQASAPLSGNIGPMEPGSGVSYIVLAPASTGVRTVVSMSNALAVVTSAALAGGTGAGLPYSIGYSGTKLWYISDTSIGALNTATLAVSVAAGLHFATDVSTATKLSIMADRNNYVWVAYETYPAFGASTSVTVNFRKTIAPNGTSLAVPSASIQGWMLGSSPFEALVGGAYMAFVTLFKYVPNTSGVPTPSASAVVPMDSALGGNPTFYGGQTYSVVRIAASPDPFFSICSYSNRVKLVATDRSTANEFSLGSCVATNARGAGVAATVLRVQPNSSTCVPFGGCNIITGGAPFTYAGGTRPTEVGFVDSPTLVAATSGAGSLSGSYRYVAQYRCNDETGAVVWSRTSQVAAVAAASANAILVKITPPCVTSKMSPPASVQTGLVCVELYRTKAGGTQYYLVASNLQSAGAGAFNQLSFTDNVTDAVLATNATLFRQPGTPNSGLDRYPPPASNIVCQHRDRLFMVDATGNRVCYSSFFVDGEGPWFNPAFSFFCHGGSGRITALVSMDGRLFVFKKDAVFVVDGDGPSEGGVVGNEFSPPQRLAGEYGCVDASSVVVTPDGIMYRSNRGIEILTRGLKVNWVGDRVWTTVNANPVTTGAVLDAFGRAHFCLAASRAATPVAQDSVSGAEVVYDSSTDSWTTYYADPGTGYGKCQKGTVMANLYGLGEVQCYAAAAMCTYSNQASGLDGSGSFVPWVVETGWIRTGQQVRQRISDAFFLAKKTDNHAIKISAAYDFNDTYTQTFTWQPDVINALTIEQLCLQLVKPLSLAVRLKVECLAPTDQATYPLGSAIGCAVLGLTFQVAPMNGAPLVSAVAQGYAVSAGAGPASLTTELSVDLTTETLAIITLES